MTYTEEPLKVTLAVGNALFGVYNFLVISIPQSWRVINTPMTSDVLSSTSQGKVKWVRDGEIEHFVSTPLGNISMRIKIWPGVRPLNKIKDYSKQFEEGNTNVGKHKAIYYKFRRRYFRKGDYNVLAVYTYCEITERTILLEFIGGEEWVNSVLATLRESQCHLEDERN